MALNFPNSPTLNQIYTDNISGFSYQWNGTVWISFTPSSSSQIKTLDDFSASFNNSTQTFSLTSGGNAVTPPTPQSLIINLGGVIQDPTDDYSVAGSNITFSTPPANGLSFSGVALGPAVPVNTVSDGSVTPVKLSTGGPSWNTAGDVYISGITTVTNTSGTVTIGIGTTALLVEGNARVTGILTVGSASITLNGITDTINVGTGVTLSSGGINITGVITATSFVGSGSGLTGVGIGSTGSINTSGIITATSFSGSGANLTGLSGGGDFNTGIASATAYAVTTGMATAYTAPATAGARHIVHSIHVTNIDGTTSADISGQLYAGAYSIANTIPVPAGSAVELLKQPKILSPSETIQLQSSATGDLHATITVETKAGDTTYIGVGTDITTAATYTDLHIATANTMLQSVLLANDDGAADVKANVVWTDGSNNIQGYYAFEMVIPADATVEILEKPKFLPNGFKIRVLANQANRLEAILSAKTI